MALVLGVKKANDENRQVITKYTANEVKNIISPKILIVEDNDMNRKIVVSMLKTHGFSCDVAENGREAVNAIRKTNYDIVFMDCQMPIMDGYESTSKVREEEGSKRHTNIVALTANAMKGDREKCIAAGMDDYMSKPIDFDQMLMFIHKYSRLEEYKPEVKLNIISDNLNNFIIASGLEEDEAKELFDEYVSLLPETLMKMKVAIENNDYEQLSKLAHQIKGSSGTLRINDMYEVTFKLEKTAKNKDENECNISYNKLLSMYN